MKKSSFQLTLIQDQSGTRLIRLWEHPSGLKLRILPKEGSFHKTAAMTVPYGSVHTKFCVENEEVIEVPAGTAHFMEHCVFSRDEAGGLLNNMAQLGAKANAYTTHHHTLYYFTATDNFIAALMLYLKHIFHAYLEKDRVEAERPIITEELNQYLDSPNVVLYNQILHSMYQQVPIKDDILGTLETIQEISPKHLKLVHQYFYQPQCLSIALGGDFTLLEDEILSSIDEMLKEVAVKIKPTGFIFQEDLKVWRPQAEQQMDVSIPQFILGVKQEAEVEALRQFLSTKNLGPVQKMSDKAVREIIKTWVDILLNTLLSESSLFYQKLYQKHVINDSFFAYYEIEEAYAYFICGGESEHRREAKQELISYLQDLSFANEDLEAAFERHKRSALGAFIELFDSIEDVTMRLGQTDLTDVNLFDYPKICDKMNYKDGIELLKFMIKKEAWAEVLVSPLPVDDKRED